MILTVPAAKNENTDGSDNPEGRQQNRRVEVVVDAREVTNSEATPDIVASIARASRGNENKPEVARCYLILLYVVCRNLSLF